MTPRRPRSTRPDAPRRRAAFLSAVEPLESRRLLAAFTVNALADAAAVNPAAGDATSTLGAGMITLRSAIQAADALAGPSTITLPAGTYPLTIPTSGADGPDVGDLNITGNLTITGAGAATTIISAQFNNIGGRVLSVDSGVAALSGVTITGGKTTQSQTSNGQGGGIRVRTGTLTLTDAVVSGNSVNDYGGLGGGIYADGSILTLTRTTVANNKADPSRGTQGGGGGGIYANNSTITLTDSTVNNNQINENEYGGFGGGKGGGIYVGGGTLNATGSTVRDNNAGHDYGGTPSNPSAGGGVYSNASAVNLSKTTVVTGNFAGQGGGIDLTGSSLDMSDGTLSGNNGEVGGGINNANGLVSLTRVDVLNNVVNNVAGLSAGGGIYNAKDGVLHLLSSAVAQNQAGDTTGGGASGGGIANDGGTLTLTNSTVRDNNTGNEYGGGTGNVSGGAPLINTGGGVYNTGPATILDSTISGNASSLGGGIENRGGNLALTDVTVSGNTSVGNGAGIEFAPPVVPSLTAAVVAVQPTSSIEGSTIAGNRTTGGNGGGIYFKDLRVVTIRNTILADNPNGNYFGGESTRLTSLGHNLSTDASAGAVLNGTGDQNSVPDAKLGPLASNGGPTSTQALLPGSPALGAGDPSGAPATDQRGLPRVVNGKIDIGAFQTQAATTTAPVLAVTGTAPASVTLPQDITYTLTVPNTGTAGATAVVLTDTLPPGVTFRSASFSQGNGKASVANGVVTLTLGNLAAGATETITLLATPSTATTVVNSVTVKSNETAAGAPVTQTTVVSAVALKATTTTLTATPNPSALGQQVTFTAVVDAGQVTGVEATGQTVTFKIDGKPQAPIPITVVNGHGQTTFRTSTLTAGKHTVVASYSGNDEYGPSTSKPLTQTVEQAPTRTTLTSSRNPSAAGQSVTFTAEVVQTSLGLGLSSVHRHAHAVHARQTAPPAGFPPFAGSVTFLDGSTVLATVPVKPDGTAAFTTSSLSPGRHLITATYGRDPNYAASTSPAVDQRVTGVAGGPLVVSVRRYGFHQTPTTLVVGFNGSLDAVSAQTASNYRITDPNGQSVTVVSAVYDAASRTVTLYPVTFLDLHRRYTLTINGTAPGGVRGVTGDLLDGTGSGQAGSNFVTTIDAANLVVTNPFASGATAALRLAAQVRAADARSRLLRF